MKVVVLVKQTPDTAELPKVAADDVRSGKVKATMVINPWDEFAAEEAILLGDRYDVDAVAVSMGSPDAVDALKHALAMGIGAAALVDNSGVTGADMWTTAAALSAAVKSEGAELVITGKQSVDDNSGAVYAGVAARLGWPLVSAVTKVVEVAGGRITVERMVEGAQETVSVPLPAVISVGKEINEPRYPSFMGIRKASKAVIPNWTAGDIGLSAPTAKADWSNVYPIPPREGEIEMIAGDTPEEQARNLVNKLFEEKVI